MGAHKLLTPKDVEGAMSSWSLKNRGHCCKNYCLHCPYGATLKKHGLQFYALSVIEHPLYFEWVIEAESKLEVDKFGSDFKKYIALKNVLIGLVLVDKLFVRHLFLDAAFQDQGISKELVESYYFY